MSVVIKSRYDNKNAEYRNSPEQAASYDAFDIHVTQNEEKNVRRAVLCESEKYARKGSDTILIRRRCRSTIVKGDSDTKGETAHADTSEKHRPTTLAKEQKGTNTVAGLKKQTPEESDSGPSPKTQSKPISGPAPKSDTSLPSSVTTPAGGDEKQPINSKIVFIIVIVLNMLTIGAYFGLMKLRKVRIFGVANGKYLVGTLLPLLIIMQIILYLPCGRRKPVNFIIFAVCVVLRFCLNLTFGGGMRSYIMMYGFIINLVICVLYLAVSFTSVSMTCGKIHIAVILTGYVTAVAIYFVQSMPSLVKPIRSTYWFFAGPLFFFTPLYFAMQTIVVFERDVIKMSPNDITLYISSFYAPFEDMITKGLLEDLVVCKLFRKCFGTDF